MTRRARCGRCQQAAAHWHGVHVVTVEHTCHGAGCDNPLTLTRAVALDGDRVRWEGTRCDGSPVAIVEPVDPT